MPKPKAKPAKPTTVSTDRLSPAEIDRLDHRAENEGRSRSELIARAVRYYLEYAPTIHRDALPPGPNGR